MNPPPRHCRWLSHVWSRERQGWMRKQRRNGVCEGGFCQWPHEPFHLTSWPASSFLFPPASSETHFFLFPNEFLFFLYHLLKTMCSSFINLQKKKKKKNTHTHTPSNKTTQQFGEILGRGGFGAVYLAQNVNTGEVVAVKTVNSTVISADDLEVVQLGEWFHCYQNHKIKRKKKERTFFPPFSHVSFYMKIHPIKYNSF